MRLLPQVPLWLAVDTNDYPVAFMFVENRHMQALFVDPACRGTGIGAALVRHGLTLHPNMTTDVNEQNSQAVGFYEKWASSALAIHLSTIKAGRTRLFILNTKAEQDRNDFDKAGEAMMRVGLVGWRGMVGSMLLKRMREEGDFSRILPTYFSTSAAGRSYRDPLGVEHRLLDANSVDRLGEMDIIITCQGGDYTKAAYPVLRASGWRGFWIDAASAKRMDDDSIIALDPVNHEQVEAGIAAGVRNYIGGNCSITLSLIGLTGLFRAGLVEWMSMMTYQAASGAGAQHVKELLGQMSAVAKRVNNDNLADSDTPVLDLLAKAHAAPRASDYPIEAFGAPLAGSIIPWIDSDLGNGMSREEWKGKSRLTRSLVCHPERLGLTGSAFVSPRCRVTRPRSR